MCVQFPLIDTSSAFQYYIVKGSRFLVRQISVLQILESMSLVLCVVVGLVQYQY